MVTPEVLEKLRAAYREWQETRGRSVETWLALMADHVELRSVADGAAGMEFSAPRAGKAEVGAYFSGLAEGWEMIRFTTETERFVVDGPQVVVFGTSELRNKRTGKTVATPLIHHWHFDNGLAIKCFEFYDTAKAFAAATPDPM